jgi:hypothetical protein
LHLKTEQPIIPSTFTTSSNVILIANEWKSLNPNVRALEDRAIILHFNPSNEELHRKVAEWFRDPEGVWSPQHRQNTGNLMPFSARSRSTPPQDDVSCEYQLGRFAKNRRKQQDQRRKHLMPERPHPPEVYAFLGQIATLAPTISMRHYCKGSQLRRAGFDDWRTSLLQMVMPDAREACVIAVQLDQRLLSEQDRVQQFIASTKCSRATYFRLKSKLAGWH